MSNKAYWLVGKMGPDWRKEQMAKLPQSCAWCEATNGLTLDHKLARSLGGNNALTNLQLLCPPCTQAKAIAEAQAAEQAKAVARNLLGGNLGLLLWVLRVRCQGIAG